MDAADTAPPEETPDLFGAYPRLSEAQLAVLDSIGTRRPTEAGEVLYEEGDEDVDFFVIAAGKVEVVGTSGQERRALGVHGPGRFLGELGLLAGQPAFTGAVVREAGEVIAVPHDDLRSLVAADASLGDVIFRAFLFRRWMLIGVGTGVQIIGSRYSPETRRLRDLCARNRIPHAWLDLDRDPSVEGLLRRLGVEPTETPIVIWRGRDVLRNPSDAELAERLGLGVPDATRASHDLVVVGAGPAGLAAAVFGASEGLDTVVLDAVATGGQAGTTSRIENYPGFPTGISGGELAERAVIQAERFGALFAIPARASGLDSSDGQHLIHLDDGSELLARTVVIATGMRYRKLGIDRLERLEGPSIYYAATMVEARLCAGDPVVIVGGGNSAGQAAEFLCKHVPEVNLVVRESTLAENMSRYLSDRVERNPKVALMLSSEVRELEGEDALEGVVVEHTDSGERERIAARAMFVFIGGEPQTDWLRGEIALTERGYVATGSEVGRATAQETSTEGVFAAGDVREGAVNRVASAVGEGTVAIRLVHSHLERRDGSRQPGQT
ncbi:FAD-dependent oxidoreductase [Thermoleophilia bacterium SCSIO 60948]|nr:FAD-dependent oxidoreductase [Thermoleophilia bacterium SCSIO 60948]